MAVIRGTNGNNSLSGTSVADTIYGLAGNDVLSGGGGADLLIGGDGNDSLNGSIGNDRLQGGAGSDTLNGGAGIDWLVGGLGDDIYVVTNLGDLLVESAGAGVDSVRSSVNWNLGANFEDLRLTGSANVNGAGNDLNNAIIGNMGRNRLDGGAGDDALNGGAGADRMTGGAGNDTYVVDNAGDQVIEIAGEGIDVVRSSISYVLGENLEDLRLVGAGDVVGEGNAQDNKITGNSGNNTLFGHGGDDTLDGAFGKDTLIGGAGKDNYYVDSSNDVVIEAANEGFDIVRSTTTYVLSANLENLILLGDGSINGTGNDTHNVVVGNEADNRLYGLAGSDVLLGSFGNDYLDGGSGEDAMEGGWGDDIYVVDSTKDKVLEAVASGRDTVRTALSYALGADIEDLVLLGVANVSGTGNSAGNLIQGNDGANLLSGLDGNDSLSGGGGADDLYGGSGEDVLDGGSGADWLNGGTGADSMSGGTGNDVFFVENAADQAVEELNAGEDIVRTSVAYTLGANVENMLLEDVGCAIDGSGNVLANKIYGNAFNNKLNGFAGNDTLDGGAGNDTLDGGAGVDVLIGGDGDDVYYVDHIGDVTVEAAGGGSFDKVMTAVEYTLSDNVEDLVQTGTAHIDAEGNNSDNRMTGNSGNNRLYGLWGEDALEGGTGNDTLDGGADADTLVGGDGNDTLYGGAGNDWLHGSDGNDRLYGEVGQDLLRGGDGDDRFVYSRIDDSLTATNLSDIIYDFTAGFGIGTDGIDEIDLSAIDADVNTFGNQAFAYYGEYAAVIPHGITFTAGTNGTTIIVGDVNGDSTADFRIVLADNLADILAPTDFIL